MRVLRVALDVPLATLFDYMRTPEIDAEIGDRVVVPFGTRSRVGVVVEEAANSTIDASKLRPASRVLADAPRLSASWLEFMRFLAGYYQRPLGETVMGALPPRLRSLKPLPAKVRDAALAASGSPQLVSSHTPSEAQAQTVDRIAAAAGRYAAFLLHGVTGSGKTEVYLRAIARVLERGGQALALVPEISLTPQLEARFRAAFPAARIAVLHSALQDVPRTAAWLAAAGGAADIVLGTRLAVLTPVPRLALVVVDEEHDTSFKQQEGLRYSGRDAAVVRAKLAGCPVVLGTATPSLETWQNALEGRYERLALPERAVPGAQLPAVRCVDLRRESAEHGFSPSLLAAVGERLARREQSLVFINRRGYAPVLACHACGWSAGCLRCTARLVLHRTDRRLRCHYCGDEAPIPRTCPTCGNLDLKAMGRGTQRVEETLAGHFPAARIVRIDRDSARRRGELARTLEGIARGEADVLVGTQLLAKGHDFPLLTLVGVLDADGALLSTDYRAAERLFATLAQVAGRAGRAQHAGEVLVQTRYPEHPLFRALARHDYAAFAEAQLAERRGAGFPPFVHEAALRAEAPKLAQAMQFLQDAARLVPVPDEVQVYDPVPHVITRRADLERAQLLVQSGSRPALQAFLRDWSERLFASAPRQVRWHLDVDPIEFD
ncbi:MAG: primosomal protein N' [Betaproteobacteria bacterium]|nr:primosomal protein N' [Betaproteobacteria bacterium]MDH5222462.1 primosomal protein N' [Betaproteobacteria bacterium]MDH5351415.1 primosomal protein N' [Betaproteobacteria bacterium]